MKAGRRRRSCDQRPGTNDQGPLAALRPWRSYFCCFLISAVSSPFVPLARAADRPNVVILFTDDQGTLDANCFGSIDLHTPNMDKLAASGVRFTQAYSHTVCCPARAALLTGRHPQRGGINRWVQGDMNGPDGINMALEEVTLAEVLKAAGYRTALYGKWHLGSHRDFGPKKQGFDEFFGPRAGFIDNYNHYYLHGEGFHNLYEGTTPIHAEGKYFPEMMTQRALKFIDDNRERPFFLYVAMTIPHYPEQSLREHQDRYKDLPEPRRSYAAMVMTTDHYIGKIMDKLESAGLRDRTIVVFQSDNGHSAEDYQIKIDGHKSGLPKGHNYGANGGGGNTGKWIGRKGLFLEGGIRTPAVISYPPRLPRGAVRDQVVTVMDWFPTILDLCGVKPPAVRLDGQKLKRVIASPDAPSPHRVMHFQWHENWAVREGDWKLIRTAARANQPETVQLFNLSDPEPERKDYMAEQPKVASRLHELHETFRRDVSP